MTAILLTGGLYGQSAQFEGANKRTVSISDLSVNRVRAGTNGFVLGISGAGFRVSAIVLWTRAGTSVALPTRVQSSSAIFADVPPELLRRAGRVSVTVSQNLYSALASHSEGIVINSAPLKKRKIVFDDYIGYLIFSFEESDPIDFVIEPSLEITTACPLPNGTVGVPYNSGLAATGGVNPVTWGGTGPLPPGLNVVGQSIQGIPTQAGNYQFSLEVQDHALNTTSKSCSMTVNSPPPPPPGSINVSCPASGAVQGQFYNSTVSAVGPAGPFTFSIVSGALPGGLTLGGPLVSGFPAASGMSQFRLRATAAGGATGERDCAIMVAPPGGSMETPLTVTESLTILTSCPLPPGKVGTQYSVPLAADGGQGPYSWGLAGGTLAPGLTLAPGGSIIGAPSYGGDYGFVLRATSANGLTGTRSCSMTVDGPGGLLTIRRMTPPAAIVGSNALSVRLQGTGFLPGMRLLWDFEMLEPVEIPVSVSNAEEAIVTIPAELLREQGRFLVALRTPATPPRVSNAVPFQVVSRLELSQACPLANAVKSRDYRQKLEARGGFPPYSFTVANRRLPEGLRIAGEEVVGQTTEEGVFEFFLVVTDGARNSAGKNCSVRVPGGISADPLTLSFASSVGGKPAPAQEVSVVSLTPGIRFQVNVVTWSGGEWLKADLSQGTTPALLRVTTTEAPEGGHQGEITLTPDTGTTPVRIQVLYQVGLAGEPKLLAAPALLRFAAVREGRNPAARILEVFNEGRGAIRFRAAVQYLNGMDWLELTPASAEVTNRQRSRMRVAAKTAGLSSGTYRANLRFEADAGPPLVIPITLAIGEGGESMLLSSDGVAFRAAAGRPFQLTRRIDVAARGGRGFRWLAKAT
jgi:hypothetical protein